MASPFEIIVSMSINVDGAPNAYGPDDSKALDYKLNARVGARPTGEIVGFLTRNNDGRTPVIQDDGDPFPGFYISTTAYVNRRITDVTDPRRYVNAAEINYVVLARSAKNAGASLGDFCVVHSLKTRRTVYAIVGDSGNSSGAEGSLALHQRLGYPARNGKAGGVSKKEIVVRYFPSSNSGKKFFYSQAELDAAASGLNLDTDFSAHHGGSPGRLVVQPAAASDTPVPRDLPFAPLGNKEVPPPYPGRALRLDSKDSASVKLLQKRLRDLGYTEPAAQGPIPLTVDGVFGENTREAVTLFQFRHTDLDGDPLVVDGVVGANTWGTLFGRSTVPESRSSSSTLIARVLEIALAEVGTLEVPPGTNRGPKVEEYQKSVGISKGDPWCAAFVYWCFQKAAKELKVTNPVIRTGGTLYHWNKASEKGVPTVTRNDAMDNPKLVRPGMIFIYSTSSTTGHTGLVLRVEGGKIVTIEGNTNDGGSREGIGVFLRKGRRISDINRGFIDYSAS